MNQKKPRELFNEQAEMDVLVAATLSREALFKVLDMDEMDFYANRHRVIYRAMVELNRDDIPVDIPTLFTKLQAMGQYDNAGGSGLLTDFSRVVMPHSVSYLITDIQNRRKQRDIIDATKDLYRAIMENKISVEDAGERMIRLLGELNTPREAESWSVQDMAARSLDGLFAMGKFVESKISSINRILKFYGGQMIVLAARPGQGKSALALQLADDLNERALFFALEMKAEHMYARMLSRHAKVEAQKIKASRVSQEEFQRLMQAHGDMAKRGKVVFYDRAHTISRIANIIRRECERDKPAAIFIDYLQLITGGEGDNQNNRIGYITRSLKLLAMQYDVPLFLLAQLNREVEKANREPVMSDLRDSGNIEQDADVVIFLNGSKEEENKSKFIVAKNRDGEIGFTELYFNKRYTFFQDIDNTHSTVPAMEWVHN